jgi:cell division protein FtsB
VARKPSDASARQRRSGSPRRGVVHQILTNTRLVTLLLLSSCVLAAMMGLSIWGERGLLAVWRKQHDIVQLVREIEATEQENARLSEQIHRLQHDMGYIEKIAREEIGLVRADELVFEFVE